MWKWTTNTQLALLLAFASVLLGSNALAASPAKDKALPEAELVDFHSGNSISLSAYKGKVIYLDFWASWCIPCKKSFPFMNQLKQDFAEDDLKIVAVNMDEFRADAQAFLEKIPADFSIYSQPGNDLATALDLPGLPVAFIIGRDGEIKARHIGFNDRKAKKKRDQINYLVAQP